MSPLLAQTEQTDVEQVLAPGAYDPRGQDLLWSTANQYQKLGSMSRRSLSIASSAFKPRQRRPGSCQPDSFYTSGNRQLPRTQPTKCRRRSPGVLSASREQPVTNRLVAVEALLRQAEWHQHMLLSNADDSDGEKIKSDALESLYRSP